jgi:hypothetical protein
MAGSRFWSTSSVLVPGALHHQVTSAAGKGVEFRQAQHGGRGWPSGPRKAPPEGRHGRNPPQSAPGLAVDYARASYVLLNEKQWNIPMTMDKNKFDADSKLKNGIFKEHFKDGTLSCIGEYSNGEKVGEWKYYLRNGLLKAIGGYSNGKMTAEWKWYRENGKLMQTGSFDDERKVGIWKRYHANGAPYDEGEYVNDKKVGEWRTYSANGKLTKTARHRPR